MSGIVYRKRCLPGRLVNFMIVLINSKQYFVFITPNQLRMTKKKQSSFERAATKITQWTGSAYAFGIATTCIVAWAVTGPLFHFSETWQLVVNTGTTIVTFLMVFLIQKTQNKDSKAIQLKLNELLAASIHASNRMVDIEDLEEKELDTLRKYYQTLSDKAEADNDIHKSHSIDAANDLQKEKEQQRLDRNIQSDKEPNK